MSRKEVYVDLRLSFDGDYIPTESLIDYIQYWLDMGFEDRDDLKRWRIKNYDIEEWDDAGTSD